MPFFDTATMGEVMLNSLESLERSRVVAPVNASVTTAQLNTSFELFELLCSGAPWSVSCNVVSIVKNGVNPFKEVVFIVQNGTRQIICTDARF